MSTGRSARCSTTSSWLSREASFKELLQGLKFMRTHIDLLALLGNALTGIQFGTRRSACGVNSGCLDCEVRVRVVQM